MSARSAVATPVLHPSLLLTHCTPALTHLSSLQVSSGALSYLGPQWRRDIAFAGNNVPMQVSAAAVDALVLVLVLVCGGRCGAIAAGAPAGRIAHTMACLCLHCVAAGRHCSWEDDLWSGGRGPRAARAVRRGPSNAPHWVAVTEAALLSFAAGLMAATCGCLLLTSGGWSGYWPSTWGLDRACL